MIKNEREYRITKAQATKLQQALLDLEESDAEARLDPLLRKAQIDSLQSQLEDLQEELDEYESVRSGDRAVISLDSLDELPRALIQARIAAGLSQRELAERLGLKEQQVQRYEATDYAGASLERLSEVIRALGLHIREDVFLPGPPEALEEVLLRVRSVVHEALASYQRSRR